MPTNMFVESSFWNFDSPFQPQQHPARDSHDTFFLKAPSTTTQLPDDYLEKVKQVHQSGGYGSKGYGYDWKRDEAEKNLLRTHTTAVSSRMLYKLAQEKPFAPKRYYSIDRVFRNEAVDRTHLAEFHQIEGLICDYGLTLGDLIGVLEDFFSRLGANGLDYVIGEAKKRGIYLILSLVNNWNAFGGKNQYVRWARDQGHFLGSDDDFFTDGLTQRFYMNHIKKMLTRVNNFTGVAYKDEPTIFAWELMNEPRLMSDLSGKTMQGWVMLMSAYVKSIDPNHMVEIGLEGFYGESVPNRKKFNPGYTTVGTDFISNNRIPTVDFATIHSYPDQWLPGSSNEAQVRFMNKWMASHIKDAKKHLHKPLLVSEFGWSSRSNGYTVAARDDYFRMVYDTIYASVWKGGPCAGGLFWQVMAPGMEGWADGYEVILERSPTTTAIVSQECAKLEGFSPMV